ncbi:hypothetical protein ACMDCR_24340 [Labrys okinawensis]|uniref:hypothetical protein n=1 Tax=Labrys okinawensis TaxID=346911 RepID=UPI0039BC6027
MDPALVAWKSWRSAHRKALNSCRKQQRLETELARTVGFPCVTFNAPELPQPVRIASLQALDELAMKVPSIRQSQTFLAAELHAHSARWEEADQRLGYSAALQQEVATYAEEARFAERLFSVEAISILGIAAKIDALIETEAPSETCDEFPWPALRKIRGDLTRIMHQPLGLTV